MNEGVNPIGAIAWIDLTVADAEGIRNFYRDVVGWEAGELDMGGYPDFNMMEPGTGTPVAGVCHARGDNADLPPQWLVYIVVASLDESLARCVARGGSLVAGPKGEVGSERFAVIRDPAGAVCALFERAAS